MKSLVIRMIDLFSISIPLQNGSSLECCPRFEGCRVKNFVFNFTELHPEKTRRRWDLEQLSPFNFAFS